jgi:hypothetical protein
MQHARHRLPINYLINMRELLIIFMTFISSNSFGQFYEFTFELKDKDSSIVDYLTLRVDDSVFVQPDLDGNVKSILSYGQHRITSDYYGFSILDTTLYLTEKDSLIILETDLVKDAYLKEFESSDFKIIYTNENYLPVIGLRDDGTFMMKSFFHISMVGCFLIEKGTYIIQNDTLILKVNTYDCPCFRTANKMAHIYRFEIQNDQIVDLDKYSGYNEKKYMGHGSKEFDD